MQVAAERSHRSIIGRRSELILAGQIAALADRHGVSRVTFPRSVRIADDDCVVVAVFRSVAVVHKATGRLLMEGQHHRAAGVICRVEHDGRTEIFKLCLCAVGSFQHKLFALAQHLAADLRGVVPQITVFVDLPTVFAAPILVLADVTGKSIGRLTEIHPLHCRITFSAGVDIKAAVYPVVDILVIVFREV